MNVATLPRAATAPASWWQDRNMVALVRRTAAKDCNTDEFDEFVSVCRDLGLNPLRKQIYAFVFSKESAERRNMVIVVGIDGMRAISARSGLYRPDNRAPRWTYTDGVRDIDANPTGLVSCEVSIFIGHKLRSDGGGEHIEWNEVVGLAHWDEFAPLVKTGGEDDYEWIDTGEVWPDSQKPKKKKRLKAGAEVKLQLDPKKDGWRKSGRHMLAKCAEAIAHRRANPEPLSRVYADEEIDRARTIDGVDYTDMTPSEMAAQGDADKRLDRIGGPALLAALDDTGNLERIPHGQFADRVMAAIKDKPPEFVAALMERNAAAFREFWAFNKNDALELKKVLEARASGAAPSPARAAATAAADPVAPSHSSSRGQDGAADAGGKLKGKEAFDLKTRLLADMRQCASQADFLSWAKGAAVHMDRLPPDHRAEVDTEFLKLQNDAAKAR